jgi:hypothetical protein
MFNNNGEITRKAWRNMFIIGLGFGTLGAAAQLWAVSLLAFCVMLYSGWYFVNGNDQ